MEKLESTLQFKFSASEPALTIYKEIRNSHLIFDDDITTCDGLGVDEGVLSIKLDVHDQSVVTDNVRV